MIKFEQYDDHLPQLIRQGKVMLHPTDTVWGLAAAAQDENAVKKIYDIKERSRSKPLILLVDSMARLKKHVLSIHPRLETLLNYHERPLTVIYNKTRLIPDYLKAEDGTIGIRIVQDYYCRKIIHAIDQPLVSTSANKSGQITPIVYEDVNEEIINRIDILFNPSMNKESDYNEPSVVARMNEETDELEFLRE